jgi:hypothetical protein
VAAPPIRAERRAFRRRRRVALGLGLLLIGAAAAAAAVFLTRDDARPQAAPASTVIQPKKTAPAPAATLHVAARDGGRLSAPLQDAAAAAVGRRVLLVGGLDAADTSTAGSGTGRARGRSAVSSTSSTTPPPRSSAAPSTSSAAGTAFASSMRSSASTRLPA